MNVVRIITPETIQSTIDELDLFFTEAPPGIVELFIHATPQAMRGWLTARAKDPAYQTMSVTLRCGLVVHVMAKHPKGAA